MNLTPESTEQSTTTEQVDSTNETASIEEEAKSSDTFVQAEQNNERVSHNNFITKMEKNNHLKQLIPIY